MPDESEATLSNNPAHNVPSELQHIIPLGFTEEEARAWLQNDLTRPYFWRGLASAITGLVIVCLIGFVNPLDEMLDSTLVLHMLGQHVLFVIAGLLLGYALYSLVLAGSSLSSRIYRVRNSLVKFASVANKRGIPSFFIAAAAVVYWDTPSKINAAVLNAGIHLEMHSALLLAGVLVFFGAKQLARRTRYLAPVVAGKAMGLFGAFLLITTAYPYAAYPYWEQAEMGVVMVIAMLIIDLTIVPIWLYGYFARPTHSAS